MPAILVGVNVAPAPLGRPLCSVAPVTRLASLTRRICVRVCKLVAQVCVFCRPEAFLFRMPQLLFRPQALPFNARRLAKASQSREDSGSSLLWNPGGMAQNLAHGWFGGFRRTQSWVAGSKYLSLSPGGTIKTCRSDPLGPTREATKDGSAGFAEPNPG